MQFLSASVGEASFGLALTIGLLLGCSLDDRVSLGRYQAPGAAEDSAMKSMVRVGRPVGAAGAPGISNGDPAMQDVGPRPSLGPQLGAAPAPGGPPPPMNACAGTRYVADLSFVCPGPPSGRSPQPQATPAPELSTEMRFGLVPSALVPGTSEVVDSNFTFAVFGLSISGRLTGQLDCASGTFNAAFTDGVASGVGSPQMASVGELSGTLDPLNGRLSGTWWHGPTEAVACTGSWIALPPL